MAGQVKLPFAQGGSITVEVAGAGDSGTRAFDPAAKVTGTFDDALAGLSKIADSLQAALRESRTPPDSVTVQFGVNFSASANLIIAASGGASLSVTMQWNKA